MAHLAAQDISEFVSFIWITFSSLVISAITGIYIAFKGKIDFIINKLIKLFL